MNRAERARVGVDESLKRIRDEGEWVLTRWCHVGHVGAAYRKAIAGLLGLKGVLHDLEDNSCHTQPSPP